MSRRSCRGITVSWRVATELAGRGRGSGRSARASRCRGRARLRVGSRARTPPRSHPRPGRSHSSRALRRPPQKAAGRALSVPVGDRASSRSSAVITSTSGVTCAPSRMPCAPRRPPAARRWSSPTHAARWTTRCPRLDRPHQRPHQHDRHLADRGLAVRRPHRSLLVAPAAVCRTIEPSLPEGVYVGYWGPNYETPAEIRAFRVLGGDLVGMSTVLEAIAARRGRRVLGLSLVTNRAAASAGPQPRRGARSRLRLRRPRRRPLARCSRTPRLAGWASSGWLSSRSGSVPTGRDETLTTCARDDVRVDPDLSSCGCDRCDRLVEVGAAASCWRTRSGAASGISIKWI